MSAPTRNAIEGYACAADALIPSYDAVDSSALLSPILDPVLAALSGTEWQSGPLPVLDLGAGTGRDARWLAGRGSAVTAVEPVSAFRAAGQPAAGGLPVTWVDDRLPDLTRVCAMKRRYLLILSNAVWHHLPPDAQRGAIRVCARLLLPGGRFVLSLRHGPTAAQRPGHPVDTRALVACARSCQLRPVSLHIGLPSKQPGNRAAGVSWDWAVFAAE